MKRLSYFNSISKYDNKPMPEGDVILLIEVGINTMGNRSFTESHRLLKSQWIWDNYVLGEGHWHDVDTEWLRKHDASIVAWSKLL